jgi:hypothetical protein
MRHKQKAFSDLNLEDLQFLLLRCLNHWTTTIFLYQTDRYNYMNFVNLHLMTFCHYFNSVVSCLKNMKIPSTGIFAFIIWNLKSLQVTVNWPNEWPECQQNISSEFPTWCNLHTPMIGTPGMWLVSLMIDLNITRKMTFTSPENDLHLTNKPLTLSM